MSSSGYVILYIILWLTAFLFFLKKEKGLNTSLGGWLILLYGFSACVSLWMLQQDYYYQSVLYKNDIRSFIPLVFLFCSILLFSSPLFLFKTDKLTEVYIPSSGMGTVNKRIVYSCICLFLISSFIIFITILPIIMNTGNLLSSDSGALDKRAFQQENYAIIFSNKASVYAYHFWSSLKDVMLCFSFYLLSKKNNKIALLLLFCSGILSILWGVANANRQQEICSAISLFLTYLLFRNTLSERTNKIIKSTGIVLFSALILVVLAISMLRFGNERSFLFYELFRYFGEAPLNFSSILFEHQKSRMWGACSFPYLLGVTMDMRRSLMSSSVGIVSYIFYSFIGNFVIDFGKIITFLMGVFVFLCSFVSKVFKSHAARASLGKIILLQLWANMCFQGVFFFSYLLSYTSILASLFFWLILKIRFKKAI